MSQKTEAILNEMNKLDPEMRAEDAVAAIVKATGFNQNTTRQMYYALKRHQNNPTKTTTKKKKTTRQTTQTTQTTTDTVLAEATQYGGLKNLKEEYEKRLLLLDNLLKLAA